MRKFALAATAIFLLAGVSSARAIDFQVGQVWNYDTRPGEEGSQIYVAKIDRDLAPRTIYHIYVDGLRLKNPLIEGGEQDHLTHVPLSREALEASVTGDPRSEIDLPNIAEGYVLWHEAFVKGQAGVFNAPVKEIVQHIEDAFNQPRQ